MDYRKNSEMSEIIDVRKKLEMSEKMSEIQNTDIKLPKDWRWVRLGEVCEKPQYGYTTSAEYNAVGPKFLRITDIQNGEVNWDSVPYCRCENEVDRYLLKTGDILFARTGGTTGKSYLIPKTPDKAIFASYLIRVRTGNNLFPEYLYQFLQSAMYWEQVEANKRGGAQPNMNATLLSNVILPLPSLQEQKLISKTIKELMHEVERARTACEKQLKAAKALPAAYLREVFESEEAKKWDRKKLGDLCEIKGGKRLPRGYEFAKDKTSYPYIRVVDMQGGSIKMQDLKYMTPRVRNAISKYTISADDVYISIAGTIGLVGIIPRELDGSNLTENAAKIVIKDKAILNRDYLWLFLISDNGQQLIKERINLVGQPKLALFRIKTILIPFPTLIEQKRIAVELKEKMTQVENLQSTIKNQQSALNTLPQAILRKAFRGEL